MNADVFQHCLSAAEQMNHRRIAVDMPQENHISCPYRPDRLPAVNSKEALRRPLHPANPLEQADPARHTVRPRRLEGNHRLTALQCTVGQGAEGHGMRVHPDHRAG